MYFAYTDAAGNFYHSDLPSKNIVLTAGENNISDTIFSDVIDTIPQWYTFYAVKIDEGCNYNSLYETCSRAAGFLNCPINLLEREYQPGKGVVLPDTNSDESYRGSYIPRRQEFNKNFLSIEMKSFYDEGYMYKKNNHMEMMVIANISDNKESADSLTAILKPEFKNTETIKLLIYMGCMH